MPSLRQRDDGRWFADFRVKENGKSVRKRWFIGTREADAARRLYEEWLRCDWPILSGEVAKASEDPTIEDIVKWYLETSCVARGVSESTIEQRRYVFDRWAKWAAGRGIIRAVQFNTQAATEYVAYLLRNLEASTASVHASTVRVLLDAAVRGEVLKENPVKGGWPAVKVKPSAVLARQRVYTPEEVASLLKEVELGEPHVYDALSYLAYTGHRPSDVITLKAGDVDLEARTARFIQEKTGDEAYVCLSDGAIEAVKRALNGRTVNKDSLVFIDKSTGLALTYKMLYNSLRRAARNAGVEDPELKGFRHSMVTQLLADGADRREVMLVTGHRSEATLSRYNNARPTSALARVNKYTGTIMGTNGHQ